MSEEVRSVVLRRLLELAIWQRYHFKQVRRDTIGDPKYIASITASSRDCTCIATPFLKSEELQDTRRIPAIPVSGYSVSDAILFFRLYTKNQNGGETLRVPPPSMRSPEYIKNYMIVSKIC